MMKRIIAIHDIKGIVRERECLTISQQQFHLLR